MNGTPNPTNLHWSRMNRKLRRLGAVAFGIPAYRSSDGFVTCPNAGVCAAICYARTGAYTIGVVARPRERNLEFLRTHPLEAFVEAVLEDLARLKAQLVRVHDGGDFFSQAYLEAWYAIARRSPSRRFYAYTKSFHLDLWSARPENFTVIQSLGGRDDSGIDPARPVARIFHEPGVMLEAGYADSAGDQAALAGEQRIGLVYHGRHFLTVPQVQALTALPEPERVLHSRG